MQTVEPPLIAPDGEVRELTAADLKLFRPARQALPLSLQRKVGLAAPERPTAPQNTPGRPA